MDGGTPITKTLSAYCDSVANCITALGGENGITGATITSINGNILFTSDTTGASSTIAIGTSSGTNAKALFGTVGVSVTGVASSEETLTVVVNGIDKDIVLNSNIQDVNVLKIVLENSVLLNSVTTITTTIVGPFLKITSDTDGTSSSVTIKADSGTDSKALFGTGTSVRGLAPPLDTKEVLKFRCNTCPHGYGHTAADQLSHSFKNAKSTACLDYTTETCPLGQIGRIKHGVGGDCSLQDGLSDVADSSNCTTCPPNTYTFGIQRVCTSCPVGKVIPADVDINPLVKNITLALMSPLNSTMRQGNPAHHFSPDACSINVVESNVGTCSNSGIHAQEYDLDNNEEGDHWITFLQNPNHALQLGTCCVGEDCLNIDDTRTDLTVEERDFVFKGFKGEWQVVSESSMKYPTGDLTKWRATTILRTPQTCEFPYTNCNKGSRGYRNDLTAGIIPASSDGNSHRMWAKFKCLEPMGCAKIKTDGKVNNKQLPEVESSFITTPSTSKMLRYRIAAIGCLPGQGLNGTECVSCPEGYVSPFVGPASDGSSEPEKPTSSSVPQSCTACPFGKSLPKGAALPKFTGLELLECAYPLNGKTSDGDVSQLGCQHVGFEKLSAVYSVVQEVGEVIYLGTRFCGANRCTQYVTKEACIEMANTIVSGNAFSYKTSTPGDSTAGDTKTNQCKWSSVTQQCVAILQSSLVVSEVSSPPKKVNDRTNLNYIRSLQAYGEPLASPIYQEADGPAPIVKIWNKDWQSETNLDTLGFEYLIKLNAVQYKRNVFVQAKCLDPLGCPGLRVSVETRGCAVGSYGAAPNCKVCSANSYGFADAPPVNLSEEKVCRQCPIGKSISALALPAQRASECACQNDWPMASPPVSSTMAGWCKNAVLRAENVLPMNFTLPNRKTASANYYQQQSPTSTRFQIVQRAGTILRFTPMETISLPPKKATKESVPNPNQQNSAVKGNPSLSADGYRVAIGGINNNSGVRIFEMSNGDWKQVGNDIEGLAEVIVPAETPVIVRYDQAPNCGSAPIPQPTSYQLKSLKMTAGDINLKQGNDDCIPSANNVDFEVHGARSNYVDDDPSNPRTSNAVSTQVPGVLTVGSSCEDRVVYFHAEAADCYAALALNQQLDIADWIFTISPQSINALAGAVVQQQQWSGTAQGVLKTTLTGAGVTKVVVTHLLNTPAFNTLFPLKIGGLATVSANNLKSLDVIFDSDSDQINDSDEMKKCQVTIEVQEEEVTSCIKDRTVRNATVSTKSFVPVLGTYDIRVNVTMFARCASEFRIGSLGAENIKKEIQQTFLKRHNTCIGSGSACLVDESAAFDGVNGIAVVFDDYMNQTVPLPDFCDPDNMYRAVTEEERQRRIEPIYDVVKEGPGLRERPSETYLSPETYEMWGAFQSNVQNNMQSARRRMNEVGNKGGEYILDMQEYVMNGPDHVGNRKAAYHGESATTTATSARNHIAMKERRRLATSGTATGASTPATTPIVVGSYTDSNDPRLPSSDNSHLYSAVTLSLTVKNVRAATKEWAQALVKDILGKQEDPNQNNRPNFDQDEDVTDPIFTTEPCAVAENVAKVLKSNNNMRPTFRWISVDISISNTIDTYEDCGLSPVEIVFIVLGCILFLLLVICFATYFCRKRGQCGGNPNESWQSCYGGFSFCFCCPFCSCAKKNSNEQQGQQRPQPKSKSKTTKSKPKKKKAKKSKSASDPEVNEIDQASDPLAVMMAKNHAKTTSTGADFPNPLTSEKKAKKSNNTKKQATNKATKESDQNINGEIALTPIAKKVGGDQIARRMTPGNNPLLSPQLQIITDPASGRKYTHDKTTGVTAWL